MSRYVARVELRVQALTQVGGAAVNQHDRFESTLLEEAGDYGGALAAGAEEQRVLVIEVVSPLVESIDWELTSACDGL